MLYIYIVFLQELGAGKPDPDESLSLIELERYLRKAVVEMEKEVEQRHIALEELRSQEQVSVREQLAVVLVMSFIMLTQGLFTPRTQQAIHNIIEVSVIFTFIELSVISMENIKGR